MALGASPADVLRDVAGQGIRMTAAGLAIGLAGALALSRLLTSVLFDVTATDPRTYALTAALLVATASGACIVPVRRAMRVDPMGALREE